MRDHNKAAGDLAFVSVQNDRDAQKLADAAFSIEELQAELLKKDEEIKKLTTSHNLVASQLEQLLPEPTRYFGHSTNSPMYSKEEMIEFAQKVSMQKDEAIADLKADKQDLARMLDQQLQEKAELRAERDQLKSCAESSAKELERQRIEVRDTWRKLSGNAEYNGHFWDSITLIDARRLADKSCEVDAKRYRWLRENHNDGVNSLLCATDSEETAIDAAIDEAMSSDGTAQPTAGAHVVFRYRGKAYNRPDSRGLCLGENMDDLCEKIPEGYFDVDIVVRADQTEGKQ